MHAVVEVIGWITIGVAALSVLVFAVAAFLILRRGIGVE
jgi:hypothetical protein